jgi:hypothetical protein
VDEPVVGRRVRTKLANQHDPRVEQARAAVESDDRR